MTLTKRQRQLLDYLRAHLADHGYAPTLDEIGRHFALTSVATVHKHLHNLQRLGLVRRHPHRSRGLELVPAVPAPRAVAVPLLGRVAAGTPIEPVEIAETIVRTEVGAVPLAYVAKVGAFFLCLCCLWYATRSSPEDEATILTHYRGEMPNYLPRP